MSLVSNAVLSFISEKSSFDFSELFLKVFAYQFIHNEPYRRLCDSSDLNPANVLRWQDVPAVPALAFRHFSLSCVPISECILDFHSSGTTTGQNSHHWMDVDARAIYDRSLATFFYSNFNSVGTLWAVMQSPIEAPHSSLSYMLGKLSADEFADYNLDIFAKKLARRVEDGKPITVFGTAFGLYELLADRKFVLPPQSLVIETGGFKGRQKEIPRSEFYALLRAGFSVTDENCWSEYGMCEMASQFYSRGEGGALYGPKWVKTRCIDPMTNDDAVTGTVGLLRHYDLANFNSVAAIQTQDRAVMESDGSFRLLGRATDAELRGCSLTAEELWSK